MSVRLDEASLAHITERLRDRLTAAIDAWPHGASITLFDRLVEVYLESLPGADTAVADARRLGHLGTFAVFALTEHPEWSRRLIHEDAERRAFVEEVRRCFYGATADCATRTRAAALDCSVLLPTVQVFACAAARPSKKVIPGRYIGPATRV
jgi:hypothetical protein